MERRNEMRQPKEVILAALQQYEGDNLERAEMAFKHLTDAELDIQHGESGKTCRQILEGYRTFRAEVENARIWVNTYNKALNLTKTAYKDKQNKEEEKHDNRHGFIDIHNGVESIYDAAFACFFPIR
jgi:hypothetical protein